MPIFSKYVVLESTESPQVVLERIRTAARVSSYIYRVRPRNSKRLPFEGTITHSGFIIHPVRGLFVNRTPPRIRGIVTPKDTGARIELHISVHIFALISLVLVAFWSIAGLYIIINEYIETGRGLWGVIFPVTIVFFVYSISFFGFRDAVDRDVLLIQRIISGETKL